MVFRDVFYSVTLYLVWLYLSIKITWRCTLYSKSTVSHISKYTHSVLCVRRDKKHTGHLCTYVVKDFQFCICVITHETTGPKQWIRRYVFDTANQRLICVEIKFFGSTSPKLGAEITRDTHSLHFTLNIILIDIRAESTCHFDLITHLRIYISFICVLWF